jgi:asparagine synthase (glutamine-hydrolysing)
MCGVVGIVSLGELPPVEESTLLQMLACIRHRGPDEFGVYIDGRAGLGSARLSIVDLHTGQQPIANEDERLWIVFNGEIFNYPELRATLETKGHRFTTQSDTEVILHLYEELGPACLEQLNGQFAIAIWDALDETLFLARDRLGVRPLFYTESGGTLVFGSEIKALLAVPGVRAEIDPLGLDQVFTYWGALAPRTLFRGIAELPPGHWLMAHKGRLTVRRFWALEFPEAEGPAHGGLDQAPESPEGYEEALKALLIDATRLRLRADVPVAAYLSGGLDSAVITALVQNYTDRRLDTFSVSFDDPEFDESLFQRRAAALLGTRHHVVSVSHSQIGDAFPEVIWHTETPLLRTAPVPLFLLSRRVHEHGLKVVLTGEGADEFLAGYDIFKEDQVRRFWARRPESRLRPLLFRRLYPYIPGISETGAYLGAFFKEGLTDVDAPDYTHRIRWHTTRRARRFFSDQLRDAVERAEAAEGPADLYPHDFLRWPGLHRAQYLEVKTFLSSYLLSSQGDRVAMGHSVEGRFPFLDHRVVEFCNRLPPRLKLRGLTDKYLLRRIARQWLPEEIWRRPKRPFRAPIHRSFFGPRAPDYVQELLSPEQIQASGLFKPASVRQLCEKVSRGMRLSETDDMALAGILSSQLLVRQFITNFAPPPALAGGAPVRVHRRLSGVPLMRHTELAEGAGGRS